MGRATSTKIPEESPHYPEKFIVIVGDRLVIFQKFRGSKLQQEQL